MKTILKTRSEEEWNGLPNKVRRWFDDALDSDDAKPSLDACIKLARELQVIANRCNNAELWRHAEAEGSEPPSLTQLKDVAGPAELKQIIEQKVINAANEALFYAEELESLGGHQFERTGVAVSLAEFQESLRRIGAVPQAILRKQGRLQEVRDVGGSQIVLRDVTALGRPTEAWHAAGRDMARAIHSAIVATGYRGARSAKNPEGATAQIGAKAVNWFFNTTVKITPDGFASAMKKRRSRTKGKPEDRFPPPNVARIKAL